MSPSSSTTSSPWPNSRPGSRPLDFRDAARKSAVPIVLTVVGLTVVVASVPVALFGTGWLLASALKIHQGWAMLLTAGAAMALGGLVAGLGGMRLRHSFDSFRRSRKQLWLNLAWLRTVLVTSASASPAPAASFVMTATRRSPSVPDVVIEVESKSTRRAGIAPADPATRSSTTMATNVQTIQGRVESPLRLWQGSAGVS